MAESSHILSIFIGIFAGLCSGLFGVGGGIVIVPLVIYFFKFNQQSANATSLIALILPFSIALSAWNYYKAGYLQSTQTKLGLYIALGMIIGAFFGSKIAVQMSSDTLRKVFAIFLAFVAVRIWFQK